MSKTDEIGVVSDMIYKELNRVYLCESYQQPRFGERLFGYQEEVFRVCSSVLRVYGGIVHYFDGMIWKPLSDVVLEYALGRALSKGKVPKGDIVNARNKLISSARGGAYMNPLNVSHTVIGFRNGVWDFSDIDNPVYHSFKDRMPVIDVLPYDYVPDAVCPKWDAFLRSVLPKAEIVKLQKYLGLGCCDRKSLTHKVEETLWLVGNGANGKSTIFDVVRAVYGAGALSYMSLDTLLSGSTDVRARFIGGIEGKLFNYCSEIQGDDITRYADAFKSLCSGEPQTVRRLGRNPETAYDIPFLIFNMNQKPTNRRMDRAMLRRIVMIPFKTTVSAADMNRELSSELMEELPGIRNWMIEGLRMLIRDDWHFTASGEADDMTDYMLENGQTVQLFLEKKGFSCNRRAGHWDDRIQWVSASAMFEDYASFCAKWLQEPVTQRMFGTEMARLGWHETAGNRKRTGAGYVYGVFCEKEIAYARKELIV